MKVTIYMADGEYVTVESMEDKNVAELLDDVRGADPEDWVSITLDDVSNTTINIGHIVRIDLDPEEEKTKSNNSWDDKESE